MATDKLRGVGYSSSSWILDHAVQKDVPSRLERGRRIHKVKGIYFFPNKTRMSKHREKCKHFLVIICFRYEDAMTSRVRDILDFSASTHMLSSCTPFIRPPALWRPRLSPIELKHQRTQPRQCLRANHLLPRTPGTSHLQQPNLHPNRYE